MTFAKTNWRLSGAEVAVWSLVAGPALGGFYQVLFFLLPLNYEIHPFNIWAAVQIYLFSLPFAYILGAVPSLFGGLLYWKCAAHVPYAIVRVFLSMIIGPAIWIILFVIVLTGQHDPDGITVALYFALTSALPAAISLALIFEARGRTAAAPSVA